MDEQEFILRLRVALELLQRDQRGNCTMTYLPMPARPAVFEPTYFVDLVFVGRQQAEREDEPDNAGVLRTLAHYVPR